MKIRTGIKTTCALLQCINLIVQKYNSPGDVVSLTSERIGFDFPAARIDYRADIETPKDIFNGSKFYIVDEMNFDNLNDFLNRILYYKNYFNPRSRYLFIGSKFASTHVKIVSSRNIFNSIFLEEFSGNIFTYFPLRGGILKKWDFAIEIVGRCEQNTSSVDNLFPSKDLDNYKNPKITILCEPIYLYTQCTYCVKDRGIEIDIFSLLCRHLEVNVTFMQANMGLMRQFSTGYTYDFVIGSLLMTADTGYELSVPYITDTLKFFVPIPHKLSKWRLILSVFSMESWCAFTLAFFIITVFWIIFFRIKHQKFGTEIILDGLDFILVFFLGRNKKCRSAKTPQELLYFNIIFLSFTMYLFFNTRLTFLLYGIVFEKTIENPKDIATNRLLIGSPSDATKNLLNEISGLENYPEEMFFKCEDIIRCLKRSLIERKFAFLLSSRQYRKIIKKELLDANIKSALKELDESYFTGFMTAFFYVGHPMLPIFNRHLNYLVESGIVDTIIQKYSSPLQKELELEPTQKLNMEHMVAPFVILVAGLSMCLLVFVWETKAKQN